MEPRPVSVTDVGALQFDETVAPLARPGVPDVDAILGVPIRVLDHGFVRLVDYMGNDAAIVQAARVSYGLGTRKRSEDKALIRYLLRQHHTSPFEMIDVKLHVKAPIFVARQWLRHRTACLTGDTVLSFDLPGAEQRGRRQHHGLTIEQFYRLWHEGTSHPIRKRKPLFLERVALERRYTVPDLARLVERRAEDLRNLVRAEKLAATREAGRIFIQGSAWHDYAQQQDTARVPMRDRLARMQLRMCDEQSGEIRHTHVTDIWQTGVKPVFKVTLVNGKTLTMTKDHRCLTERGWMTLEQATGLRLTKQGGVTWRDDAPAFATNGVPAHQSAEWLGACRRSGYDVQAMADEAGVSYHTIRKWLRLHGLGFTACWPDMSAVIARPAGKPTPSPSRLFRQWSKIARIEYAGAAMTYDLSVAGPYHNFVANGFIVHNSVNEVSARYSILPEELYLPDDTQVSFQSADNKQGRSAAAVSPELKARVRELLLAGQHAAYAGYQEMLDAEIARELARIALPVSVYTEWYWKINLHNLFHFLELRVDPHAQYEIRMYGEAICLIVQRLAPLAYEAFVDYARDAVHLSAPERAIVARALHGEAIRPEDWGRLGKRERAEFARKFGLTEPTDVARPALAKAESAANGHVAGEPRA
jgi:thymidylate synthase ThyX